MSHSPNVLIVGAGLAGLAAATALSSAGAAVTLLERKPYVGGRAYSYPHPALDEVIDSQHVLLGCCTNLIDLCQLAGADRHIRWYDGITFLEPADGARPTRASELGAGSLPAPLHSMPSFLRASMLGWADKAGIAKGMSEFLRGYPSSDEEALSTWLRRTRQTERAIRHFWEPLILATVNDTFENCSTRYAGKVIHEVFLASPEGSRLGIPTQPLSTFYDAVADLAVEQGTVLHRRASVDRIERLPDGRWRALTAEYDEHIADQLLLALPFEQTAKLLQTLPEGSAQREAILPVTERFQHAPISTLHLWFEREITPLHHAALLDTRIQWLFNKSRIRRFAPGQMDRGQRGLEDQHDDLGGQHYIELVISGSFAELHQTRDQILSAALAELERFFPIVRGTKLLKSGVLKEARATFSVVPGLDRYRPQPAAGDGLYLAGDWTRTDWPSTMEGAVRSGRLAAEAIAADYGESRRFITSELAPNGLFRLMPGASPHIRPFK